MAVGSVEGATTAAIEAEPKKRGWNPFRRKAAKAEEAVAADLELAAANTSAGAEAVVESADAAIKSAETAIETAADDAVAPVVEVIEPAKTKRSWNPFRRKPKESLTPAAAAGTSALATDAITAQSLDAAPRVADAAAAAPEARATNSKLEEPYVQIGIFSLEANANDTATALRQNGVVPHVYKQESSGKSFWRVVAGPSNSKVDRAALIKKVKEMGFTDAYPVRG
ncbi:SPOR domain-containing protein [Tropicimonas sp. IMCC6043]|uniref:SPOR domain-containing protein n=1 Tax=Tropicimonas sp. IMCC6043 TaxID=2510645 RepID=UPI001F5C87BD|nr:SPOR domain-containing protein [Tropicimonas sp. IMCC6043]